SRNVDTITRMARAMNCSIFVANAATLAGLGAGGEGFTSFSIATPTGEGLTRPRTFSRLRRLTVAGALRIT
ncbi:MAG: aldehyde dehydrogenase EutE, partial [Acidobacteriota bacterium]